MLSDPTLVPHGLQNVIGGTLESLHDLDNLSKGKVVGGVRDYMVGKKLRTMYDARQASKEAAGAVSGDSRFGGMFKGVVEKSYALNSYVDDHIRAMRYLAEYDKQIAKGVDVAHAEYMAVGKARQILQDWLGQTPFERNVIKSILPFYGFIGHAMRFVLRYPLDHPLRAEFMAKLAEAEMEDNNMGLPGRFMSMLFFGKPDSKGNQHSFNLGPFNPFGDVANSMTLAGFLGNTNPVIQTMFQMVGIDQGTAELYPSLRYDPNTGRMEAVHPGFLESMVGNTIPQASGVLALMGMNSQFNDMLQRDPDSAGRYLLSAMTVPTLERQYNIPQEQFAAELAREKSQQSTLNDALKSGSWSDAMKYPSLVAYLRALDNLPADQLQPFAPTTRDSMFTLAQNAFGGQPAKAITSTTLDQLVQYQLSMGGVPSSAGATGGFGGGTPLSGLASGGALGLNGI